MTLIGLIIGLFVIGLILWAINRFARMDAKVKAIMNCAAIIGLAVWLVQVLIR